MRSIAGMPTQPLSHVSPPLDVCGVVRIWDATQPEHALKAEYKVLAGRINELAWDSESQHLIVVGAGKNVFAHAINIESGISVGELAGPTKSANGVAIRAGRPLRAAIASDDLTVSFYQGLPYRHAKTLAQHTRFALSVVFSPCGNFLATGGADSKIYIYDGLEGNPLYDLAIESGAVTGLSWTKAGLASCSTDGAVRIWDVENRNLLRSYKSSSQILGIEWVNDRIYYVDLDGIIMLLDAVTLTVVAKLIGHVRGINDLLFEDGMLKASASYDGRLVRWPDGISQVDTSIAALLPGGEGTFNKLDMTILIAGAKHKLDLVSEFVDCFDLKDGHTILCFKNVIALLRGAQIVQKYPVPNLTAASLGSGMAGLYYSDGDEIFVFSLQTFSRDTNFALKGNVGKICSLAVSPDEKWIAAGDDQRRIQLYNLETGTVSTTKWCLHRARVHKLAWSPDSALLASAGLDNSIVLWSPELRSAPWREIKNAHRETINVLQFTGDCQLVSAGQDATIRFWKIAK